MECATLGSQRTPQQKFASLLSTLQKRALGGYYWIQSCLGFWLGRLGILVWKLERREGRGGEEGVERSGRRRVAVLEEQRFAKP